MNAVTGTVTAVNFALPFGEAGRVTLCVGEEAYDLFTRDTDTDICFDGQTVRGSDVVAALLEAEGNPVDVILWLRDGKPAVCAKFTTGS